MLDFSPPDLQRSPGQQFWQRELDPPLQTDPLMSMAMQRLTSKMQLVGDPVGFSEGFSVGFSVGFLVGFSVGFSVGALVGPSMGERDGETVGYGLASLVLGLELGMALGSRQRDSVSLNSRSSLFVQSCVTEFSNWSQVTVGMPPTLTAYQFALHLATSSVASSFSSDRVNSEVVNCVMRRMAELNGVLLSPLEPQVLRFFCSCLSCTTCSSSDSSNCGESTSKFLVFVEVPSLFAGRPVGRLVRLGRPGRFGRFGRLGLLGLCGLRGRLGVVGVASASASALGELSPSLLGLPGLPGLGGVPPGVLGLSGRAFSKANLPLQLLNSHPRV